MISRVTNQTLMRSAQRNLQTNMAQLAQLQEQASSRKAITRPSDDPGGTASALRVRAELRAAEQYGRNIADGDAWLTTIDSAFSATNALMRKVRDLTVQGANEGTMSPAAKEAIAVELDGLKTELLAQANTKYMGRSVFAGNSDQPAAFTADADGDIVHVGSDGTVERRVNAESTVRVDADGAAVFGTGGDSVFALIDTIVQDLRDPAAEPISAHLDAIDDRVNAILGQQASAGARLAQIERAEEANVEQAGALEIQRSGIEDIDLGRVILDLKMQEVSYQAALAVTARVLQPTLMDFLR
ncbi:flagellar hook-associated protein FlgL [Glaciibacter superstes]|uniref:flagellar hook-associated protein FlgL n=1 Tax=Glaciibacter superstes TaxID=501023 RepID=UPI0003B7182B|nr:flagellar hook-associated protein FlgL [Glaciibacter superstes]